MLKKEWYIFLHGLQFYTRIPCKINYSEELLQESTRYFSLIGILVGIFSAFVFIGSTYILPLAVAIALSMLTSILITGAFHEDGLADVCDGFGGGWTKEKIITIMKDSRNGTFGVIGLVFALGLKFVLLYQLASTLNIIYVSIIMIAAHSISRFMAVTFLFTHVYVNDATANAKAKPIATQLSPSDLITSLLISVIPLILLPSQWLWLCIIPLLMTKFYLGYWFKKWIGGYTGDCLGATQQITEIVFYVSMLVLWKYI